MPRVSLLALLAERTLNDGAPGEPDIGLTPKSETEVTIRCPAGAMSDQQGDAKERPVDPTCRSTAT